MKHAFLLIACLVVLLQFVNGQQSKMDSLEIQLAGMANDTAKVNVLYALSKFYRKSGTHMDKVLTYAEASLNLARELEYPYGIGHGYVALGSYYYVQSLNEKALQHYQQGLIYLQKAGSKQGLGLVYNNLGMVSEDMGNYSQALEYYLTSTSYAEAINDLEITASNLGSISILMLNQKKYQEALDYGFKALKVCETTNNSLEKAFVLNSIGVIYYELNSYDNSVKHLHQAQEIFTSTNHMRGLAACYNNLGMVYAALQDFKSSASFYQKALEKSEANNYPGSMIIAQNGIANIYLKEGKTQEAIHLYLKSLQLAETHQLAKDRLATYEGLSHAYAQIGDMAQAYHIQSKFLSLNDSLFNEENNKKIAQLQANYEVEKKQAEIDLLQKDQQRATLIRNFMWAGILGIFLIAALIVSRQRLKIRQDRLLLEKGKEVAHKNELLEEQAKVLASQAAELSSQTAKLQEMDEAKSRFFANISHEFRTPLTLILNNLEDKIEQESKSESSTQELSQLQVMHRNARRLLQLINQLLDLSKLESGKMKLELKEGDLKHFLSIVSVSFSSLADFRQIQLGLSLPDDPLLCRFDADKLEKILYNLLSNAFKFTPHGGSICLEMKYLSLDDQNYILLTVQNSGPGIASEQLAHVFDRFYQGKPYYKDEQGTGIGLALTKELVDLHGGKIWAESSEEEKGTTFFVQLPFIASTSETKVIHTSVTIDLSQEIPAIDEVLPIEGEQLPKATASGLPLLLLVEDNQDLRTYIRKHLEDKYEVIESENGREGLEKATQLIPDLIITDRMMPEMDGLELCRRLKEDERTSHIPLIMLTALATDEGKLKGLETGADEYLTKPFDRRELDIRIYNLIENRRKLRERYSKVLQLEPSHIQVSSADDVFLQKVLKVVEDYMDDAEFSTEEFGRQVGLSRMQLHRKLKALTGQTPGDLLRMMRLKRAAQLLDMQAGNISEIAYQVGFNNLSYFAKCFRDQFGMNPNEYISRQAASSME